MHSIRAMLTTTFFLALGLTVAARPQTQDLPSSGLYCCPTTGPNGLPLNRQQNNPYAIFCYYDEGTEQRCFYNPGTGVGGGPAAGCPTQAPANPPSSTCPYLNRRWVDA